VKFPTIVLLVSVMTIDLAGQASQVYSKSELKRMLSTAQTSDDFNRLAVYFDQRSEEFQLKAGQEENELNRLLALPYHARSYPTQVERTRDLITRYKTQASTSADRAKTYHERAKVLAGTSPSSVSPPPVK
jgi:hypothetical protein